MQQDKSTAANYDTATCISSLIDISTASCYVLLLLDTPELPHGDPSSSSCFYCVTATITLATPTLIEEREALTRLPKNVSEAGDSGKATTRSLSTPLAPGCLQLRQPIPVKRSRDPFKNIQQNSSHVLTASSLDNTTASSPDHRQRPSTRSPHCQTQFSQTQPTN